MKVLVVDVGGSHVKVLATGRKTPIDKMGRTYEDYVGKAGLKRLGKKKWRGNAKLLDRLPRGHGRGRFYEEVGAIRDVFQNHLLQLLTMLAMEAPVANDASAIADAKVALLRAIRPPQA